MTDYRQQMKDYFRETDKHHHRSRRAAQRAADEYRRASEIQAHVRWLTGRPDLWDEFGTPASWEATVRAITWYADYYLRQVFSEQRDAQFYNQLGRDYEQMAIRDEARTREVMTEASDRWCETHPAYDGDDRTPLEVLDAGVISVSEFWDIVRGE